MQDVELLFKQAQRLMPGGVSSPVRAGRAVETLPLVRQRGYGPYVVDITGCRYIDYVMGFGPLIVGHAHPKVRQCIDTALADGWSSGYLTELEVKLAEKIIASLPAIEMIRFTNSGTEAVMTAMRLARAYTKRDKILKFSGCYHGHADALLVAAGSGALTYNIPNSAGVPHKMTQDTLLASYNSLEEVAALFAQEGEQIAAVLVEPVAGNMNCILPLPGFLAGLREYCDRYGSLLIFDEVMTGFRVALGGAQTHYHITPDLTVLGKVIGGGFPIGAVGGKYHVMANLAPLGPVYQAGTFSGHPIVMAAGGAQLELVAEPGFYQRLGGCTQQLVTGLREQALAVGIPCVAHAIGGMFGLFFTTEPAVYNEKDVKKQNMTMFKCFFQGLLAEGIYFAPSAFEAGFVSSAHGDMEITETLQASAKVLAKLACV